MRHYFLFTFIVTLFTSHLFGATSIVKGIVIDDQKKPVSGAVVTLLDRDMSCITKYDGTFSFVTSSIDVHSLSLKQNPGLLRYSNHTLIVNNPLNQSITLTVYDLKGRTIAHLYDNILQPGKFTFSLPDQIRNQTSIIQMKSTTMRQSMRIAGTVAAGNINTFSGIPECKTAIIAKNTMKVTHSLYDEKHISYSSQGNDSLTIQLYKRLSLVMRNFIKIGDTLSNLENDLKFTIDSISDHRCNCNVLCNEPGNAYIYVTFIKNSTSMHLVLQSNDQPRDTASDYVISLDSMNNCHQSSPDKYQFQISVFPLESSVGILFLEHFTRVNGTFGSEITCSPIHIDFPTYSYNKTNKILDGGKPYSFNDKSLKAILGEGVCLSEAAGAGCATGLLSVTTTPFTSPDMVVLESISSNGTVQIKYRDLTFDLAPGQSWTKDSSYIEFDGDCQKNLVAKEYISNYGYLKSYQIILE